MCNHGITGTSVFPLPALGRARGGIEKEGQRKGERDTDKKGMI